MKAKLNITDFQRAAKELNCEVAAIRAVASVESLAGGFLPDGRPKILFERHVFHQLSGGKFSVSNPDISNKSAGGYGRSGTHQHERLAKASALDRNYALMSASWGMFQIMGYHWKALGYKSLQAFINAMYESEAKQLDAFVRFIKVNRLDDELRNKQWAKFARGYNGPAYAKNKYDVKMAEAYKKYSR